MNILDRVKLTGESHNGEEGILISINNNTAYVVLKHKIDDKLQGYIRVEVNVLDLEQIL